MRYPAGAVLSFASVALLIGCADQPTQPLEPGVRPSLSLVGAPVCDIPQLKKDARSYVASNQDPIFTIISALQTELKNGRSLATRAIMFQGWTRIAEVRGTSAQASNGTPAHGNAVARGFLGCADDAFIITAPATADYTAALTNGMFEVIADARLNTATPGYSKGGTEIWATHPPANHTWGQISGNTNHLIYGEYTTLQTPDPQVSTTSFDFSTSPTGMTYTPGVVRGVCIADGSTYRIQRNTSILLDAPLDCSGAVFSSSSIGNPLASFAYHVLNYLIARPLQAQAASGVAGMGSEYSDHIAISVNVVLTFVSQPQNGFVDTPIPGSTGPVAVKVETQGGTPLPNVQVVLSVAGNEGTNVVLDNYTADTDADGIAIFPYLTLNKAGGYRLWANAAFDGLGGAQITSDLFNIQNK